MAKKIQFTQKELERFLILTRKIIDLDAIPNEHYYYAFIRSQKRTKAINRMRHFKIVVAYSHLLSDKK